MYNTEYKWLNEHGQQILKPLNQLKQERNVYLPGHVEFKIKDGDKTIFYPMISNAIVPLTGDNIEPLQNHYSRPLIAGSRYILPYCIAKMLEEVFITVVDMQDKEHMLYVLLYLVIMKCLLVLQLWMMYSKS